MSEPWITRVHDACYRLRQNAEALDHLADSLSAVGLEKPATRAGQIADRIHELQDAIMTACREELADGLKYAESQTAGLLKLALHGALNPHKREGER